MINQQIVKNCCKHRRHEVNMDQGMETKIYCNRKYYVHRYINVYLDTKEEMAYHWFAYSVLIMSFFRTIVIVRNLSTWNKNPFHKHFMSP